MTLLQLVHRPLRAAAVAPPLTLLRVALVGMAVATLPGRAEGQRVALHSVVIRSHPEEATASVTVRWDRVARGEGVWLFLKLRSVDDLWRHAELDSLSPPSEEGMFRSGPVPSCRVAQRSRGVLCTSTAGFDAPTTWVVSIPLAHPAGAERAEVAAFGLGVPDGSEGAPGPSIRPVAPDSVSDGVYAGFLDTSQDEPAKRIARHRRYCAGGCTVGALEGRFIAVDPSRVHPIPPQDREAFARWAALDVVR